MSITQAATKGGEKKYVHSEFDDGYAIGFFDSCDYIPLLFCWDDAYDCAVTSVLTSEDLYHNRLMRNDGGLHQGISQEIYTFDWHEMKQVPILGLKHEDGSARYVTGYELNNGRDTSLHGVHSTRIDVRRRNRAYWTPGHTTQNESGPAELFTVSQIAHSTCPFDCGDDGCHHDTFREITDNIYRVGECS